MGSKGSALGVGSGILSQLTGGSSPAPSTPAPQIGPPNPNLEGAAAPGNAMQNGPAYPMVKPAGPLPQPPAAQASPAKGGGSVDGLLMKIMGEM